MNVMFCALTALHKDPTSNNENIADHGRDASSSFQLATTCAVLLYYRKVTRPNRPSPE